MAQGTAGIARRRAREKAETGAAAYAAIRAVRRHAAVPAARQHAAFARHAMLLL
jgi:hypothetical protein